MQRDKACVPCHDERGFTIIELVVAITILATVSVVVVSSFTGTLRSIERAQEIADSSQVARLVMERMFSDLSSTFFVSEDESYQFLGLDEDDERERGPTLSFATLAPGMPIGGTIPMGMTRVEYFLGPHPEVEEGRALYRRESSLLAGASGETRVHYGDAFITLDEVCVPASDFRD